LYSLSAIALQQGQYDVAVQLIKEAIAVNPRAAKFHNSLGVVSMALGKPEQAIAAYKRALTVKPDYAAAYKNMGNALLSQGRYDEAIVSYKSALRFRPNAAQIYNRLGAVLDEQGCYGAAVESYRRALQLKPDYVEACNNLALALRAQGEFAEAIELLERAIQLRPRCANLYYNLAGAQRDFGMCEEAVANYDRAIGLEPGHGQAHFNRAIALLLSGHLTEGWKAYRWRRKADLKLTTYPHRHDVPRWDGSSFEGRRLLVHYEQGMGDTLQFVRYLPQVKQRGGTVILEARKPLMGLLRNLHGVDELVAASNKRPTVPFDLHASLLDLPETFATSLETIPSRVPYIHAEPEKVAYWQRKLPQTHLNVGITWAGSPAHRKDRTRSCFVQHFGPLAYLAGVRLFALQKGPAARQLQDIPEQTHILNLADECEDFADTAAVIQNLDLVISVDTAVLHLAAAMAKPVWALLPYVPDWRWMLHRRDSPWYPTMRLFRQPRPGDWSGVFCAVREQLEVLASRQQYQRRESLSQKLPH
jgi:tetratricopeptide (TPR) repeat protein